MADNNNKNYIKRASGSDDKLNHCRSQLSDLLSKIMLRASNNEHFVQSRTPIKIERKRKTLIIRGASFHNCKLQVHKLETRVREFLILICEEVKKCFAEYNNEWSVFWDILIKCWDFYKVFCLLRIYCNTFLKQKILLINYN
jgi:hypothetical protein